jgi:hypothetical protein
MVALHGCGGRGAPAREGAPPAGARRFDASALAPNEVPRAVLEECHPTVMHRMRSVRARVTIAPDRTLLVQAVLPGVARVRDGSSEWLVRGREVARLDGAAAAEAVAQDVRDVVEVVDAAAFGPLHRASVCVVDGDGFQLEDGDGAAHALRLFEGTLLPATLGYGDDVLEFVDYLRTNTTWIARGLLHPRLGACSVLFEDGGVMFDQGFFEPAGAAPAVRASATLRTPLPGVVVETQSATPIVVDGKATQLVLLPDPGDWAARHETYRPVQAELERQGQRIAGFPLLFVDDASRGLMAAPFRRRRDGAAFEAPPGYALGDVPKGRLLVVYPPDGDVDARARRGRQLLERALANRGLTAKGPIVAQPFLHLHEAAPDPAQLEGAKVRVWVRIE